MAPPRFALLAAHACPASQVLFSAVFRLPLVADRGIELIGFDRALQLALPFIGHGGLAQPPAPPRTRTAMDTSLPGTAPGRTGETSQKGGEYPVRQWPLALVQQGIAEVVEGVLAAVTPVTVASGSILVCAPASNMVALAARTLQRTVFPWAPVPCMHTSAL
jgi:hypothetical protein